MPVWFMVTLLAAFILGFYPILGDKAGQIHGPKMNLVIDGAVLLVFSLIFLIFYRQEVTLITKKSLVYGLLMGLFCTSGFILILYAWQWAPTKLPKIMVTIGFSAVITAIISNFTGARLTLSEWLWALGATICIAGLNWRS